MDYKYYIKNISRHLLLVVFTVAVCFVNFEAAAQTVDGHQITGKVTASSDEMGLPGLSIAVKGTGQGTITDLDGNYTLTVEDANATLMYSFVGFTPQEIAINGQSVINVVMEESSESLDEVVVTALGIKRAEKSLGYSVGKVDGEELTRVVQENVLNSMAGKVSGVTINSTGGTGSSVSMVIRGASSLSSDNQPLFVVDGVPMSNTLNNIGGFGSGNKVDYGNAISDLDPENIENVTILKGPSAAALYGSRAGNGVVLITTKTSKDTGKMNVSVTSNTVFDIPSKFVNVHSQFSDGGFPLTPESVGSGILPSIGYLGASSGIETDKGYWAAQFDAPLDANGVPIPTEVISHPDNVKNFVNTGITSTNGVAISNSTENGNYRLGVTNMSNNGIIPNSDLFKNSYSLSVSSNVSEKLTVSTNVNFNHSWSNNRPATQNGANPLQWAYKTPANVDIERLKDYWVPGKEGLEARVLSPDYNNPYFLANEVNNSFSRYRIYGNVVADYQISPSFSLMGRYVLNKFDDIRETKMAPGYSDEPNNGAYGIRTNSGLERNMDALATYKKDWQDFNLSVSAGGNILYQKGNVVSNSSKSGSGLIVPNVFTVNNISSGSLAYASSLREKSINSIYALANFGWKDLLFLDLTARNDWSSTLPSNNRSYFYPSASLSVMMDKIFNLGEKVNMLKLRGGYAQVGNDTDPYSLTSVYGNAGQWDDAIRLSKPRTLLTQNLKPEESTSYEFGLDLKMFQNRLRFEGTYYAVDNRNQILGNIPLAPTSGYSNINLNAGLLQSTGFELLLGVTPINKGDWNWDLNLNFSKNKTVIKELAEGVEFIQFWSDNKSKSLGYAENAAEGHDGLVGNIYSPRMARVKDKNSEYFGYPIITNDGGEAEWKPEDELSLVGNYNPDFVMGLQSSFSYKNFTLSMTFDWRNGGQYMSQTARYFTEDSNSQSWLDNLIHPGDLGGMPSQELRDWVVANEDEFLLAESFRPIGGPTEEYGGFPEDFSPFPILDGAFAPGVRGEHDADGNFILEGENLGGEGTIFQPYVASFPWAFGTPVMYDADYIKLREISINYQLPNKIASQIGMQNVNFSIYSRNIMLWTKDSDFGIDPERAFQAESSTGNRGTQYKQGIERYNVDPWVIPIGFKVGFTF